MNNELNFKSLAKRYFKIDDIKRNDPMMNQDDWNMYSNEENEIRKILHENGFSYDDIYKMAHEK